MSQKVRQVLKSVTHAMGNRAYRKKQKKNPSAFFTLRQLCEKVGLDTNGFDASVQSKLDRTVSYICRYGDRFTENCICVQLYEDSDAVMKQAVAEGALVCVTDHPIDGVPCIVVAAPAVTYADLCSIYRDMSAVKTTVVAGSIGKTTTKKMIEAVYSQDFHTLCDAGNDNILDSVGSICQHIPASAQHYIAELSEDTPGLISQMSKIAKPDVAVFTAIDKSHIEFYGSEENILNEFRSVTKHMRPNGVCIMSLDEANTADLIQDRKVVFVSVKSQDADFFASDITVDNEGLHFTVSEKATGNTYPIVLHNVYAVHNVTTALLAFAAGVVSGVPYNHIQGGAGGIQNHGDSAEYLQVGQHGGLCRLLQCGGKIDSFGSAGGRQDSRRRQANRSARRCRRGRGLYCLHAYGNCRYRQSVRIFCIVYLRRGTEKGTVGIRPSRGFVGVHL